MIELESFDLILSSQGVLLKFKKVYNLPKVQFKSKKFKLTALEGSKMLRAKFGKYSVENHDFHSLMTITNQGDLVIFNLDSEKKILLDQRFLISLFRMEHIRTLR